MSNESTSQPGSMLPEAVLYDPSVAAGEAGRVATQQFVTGAIESKYPDGLPKNGPSINIEAVYVGGHTKTALNRSGEEVVISSTGTPVLVEEQGNQVLITRDKIKDDYHSNIVDNEIRRRKESSKEELKNAEKLLEEAISEFGETSTEARRAKYKLAEAQQQAESGRRSFRSVNKKDPEPNSDETTAVSRVPINRSEQHPGYIGPVESGHEVVVYEPPDSTGQELVPYEPTDSESDAKMSLRDRFKDWRRDRAIRRRDRLQLTARAILEGSDSALYGGVYAGEPDSRVRPRTPIEVRAAERASRKSKKALAHSFEKSRISSIYGSRPEDDPASLFVKAPLFERAHPETTDEKRRGDRVTDIGTVAQEERLATERYTKVEEKYERKATKRWSKARKSRDKKIDGIRRQRNGEDLRGRIRNHRINRANDIINS